MSYENTRSSLFGVIEARLLFVPLTTSRSYRKSREELRLRNALNIDVKFRDDTKTFSNLPYEDEIE
jgi:hypothetical protein